jgi:hypothetical protein
MRRMSQIAITTLVALTVVTAVQAGPRGGAPEAKRTFHLTVAGRPSATSLNVTGVEGVKRVIFSRGSALVRNCEEEGKTRSLAVLKQGDQFHVNGVRRGDTIYAYGAADKLHLTEQHR